MELILQIVLGIISLICLGIGLNLLIKGAKHFSPESVLHPKLDNVFRFLSGMFFSFGFLLIWIVFHIHEIQEQVYFIGMVVAFAGLGRLYSMVKVGSAGKYQDIIMILEILLGLSIIVLQYFR